MLERFAPIQKVLATIGRVFKRFAPIGRVLETLAPIEIDLATNAPIERVLETFAPFWSSGGQAWQKAKGATPLFVIN